MHTLPKLVLFVFGALVVPFQSCKWPGSNKTVEKETASADIKATQQKQISDKPDQSVAEENPDDYSDYYVLIADSGMKYAPLREAMLQMSASTGTRIDTMNRSYRTDKNLIALPDDDEDEMYAGDYFPRRFPGDFLSIEYLAFYDAHASEKAMGLIAGIYEKKDQADSALQIIQKKGYKAISRKTRMFIGCLH